MGYLSRFVAELWKKPHLVWIYPQPTTSSVGAVGSGRITYLPIRAGSDMRTKSEAQPDNPPTDAVLYRLCLSSSCHPRRGPASQPPPSSPALWKTCQALEPEVKSHLPHSKPHPEQDILPVHYAKCATIEVVRKSKAPAQCRGFVFNSQPLTQQL